MATEQKFETIAQISGKKCGCDARDAIKEGKQVYLYRVFGEATDSKAKESRGGDPYTYLIGEFRLITAEGKGFESNKLFLPAGLLESIEGSLKAAGDNAVQFAYDVFSTPDKDTTIGYRYAAKALIQTEASDRLAALTGQLGSVKPPTEKAEKPEKKSK